jgi:hypothetical protein
MFRKIIALISPDLTYTNVGAIRETVFRAWSAGVLAGAAELRIFSAD